ncbi:MAG: Na+/H+ antiporter NhaA [Mariprofundaceae bacterium]
MTPSTKRHPAGVTNALRELMRSEAAGGILLMAAGALAMIIANSPLANGYLRLIDWPMTLGLPPVAITKPAILWINDGLMAVFFLLVGLELKREIIEGELRSPARVALPAFGAAGGMIAPALIYVGINAGDPAALRGWAIPVATDIAFALGVLLLLGPRVPAALKVFLVSLAIFDDLGAIVIIALFYADAISPLALGIAAGCAGLLWLLNRRGVARLWPYLALGSMMWVAVLKSGVHATLAGVLLALFIPLRAPGRPLARLEHRLHGFTAFVVLPVFAFANAGVPLGEAGLAALTHPVPLGVMLGLALGKPIGVFGLCWLALRLRLARLPEGMRLTHLFGIALLCGIGFTMSLFIGGLAFEEASIEGLAAPDVFDERLGVLAGSLISALLGWFALKRLLALPAS